MREARSSEGFRQAAPALFVGAAVFVASFLRTGSPGVAAAIGILATLFLGPPVWVGWDAQRLGLRHPIAWAVFALFTTPVGAIIYYLLRPSKGVDTLCSSCSASVMAGYSACPWCGTPCEPPEHSCPSCHSAIEEGWSFCPYCRDSLEEPLAKASPE